MTARVWEAVAIGGLPALLLEDDRARVELLPTRGALVSRYAVDGRDVLFLDEATVVDPSKNVRGGVPLLFPNPGPLPQGAWPGDALGQHGFARRSAFDVVSAVADEQQARVELELTATAASRAAYPYDFAARFAVSLQDGRLLLEWRLTNTGTATLPWQFGLHPYFRVDDKARARVPSPARTAFDNVHKRHVPFEPPRFDGDEVDLHLLDHGLDTATLHGASAGDVTLRWTPALTTLVLWTLPQKPFVCVEPWTGPAGALTRAPLQLAAGATAALAVEVEVRKPE